MAICFAMSIAVSEIIAEVGIERLQRFSGIPLRTLYRWKEANRLPGSGSTLEWRISQFKVAAAQAAAEKAKEEQQQRMAPAKRSPKRRRAA